MTLVMFKSVSPDLLSIVKKVKVFTLARDKPLSGQPSDSSLTNCCLRFSGLYSPLVLLYALSHFLPSFRKGNANDALDIKYFIRSE